MPPKIRVIELFGSHTCSWDAATDTPYSSICSTSCPPLFFTSRKCLWKRRAETCPHTVLCKSLTRAQRSLSSSPSRTSDTAWKTPCSFMICFDLRTGSATALTPRNAIGPSWLPAASEASVNTISVSRPRLHQSTGLCGKCKCQWAVLFGKYVSYHILFLFQLSMPPFLGLCRRICCCVCTFPAIHHYPDRFSNCLFRNNIHLMALRNLCRLFGSLNRTFICTSVFCCVLYLNIIIMTIIFTNKIYLFGPKVFFHNRSDLWKSKPDSRSFL